MTLQRRKPMAHGGKPLLRTTALRAVRPLFGGGTLRRTEMVTRRRNTDPKRSVVNLVKDRARRYTGELPDGTPFCEVCTLRPGTQKQHRRPRGRGGSRRASTNAAANLIWVCGDLGALSGCHLLIEANRSAALAEGWLVPQSGKPADVPVRLGADCWLLDDAGGRTLYTPTERTAT